MNVEMPAVCRQGEQVGIRVTVFNYMMKDIEVMVVLANSPNYKFIHVESYGIVHSYAPRTSMGEHQHLVWIRAQDSVQVHLPIVATVLGEIEVNIRLIGQIARDEVTRKLRIEVNFTFTFSWKWSKSGIISASFSLKTEIYMEYIFIILLPTARWCASVSSYCRTPGSQQ